MQQLFRGAERGRAFGAFGFTVSVSSAVGPILGGLIIAAFGPDHGWRYIFLVNIPIGLVAMYFIARLVPGRPTDAEAGTARDLDLVGALLLGLTVLALLYPLVGVIGESRWVLGLVALAPPLVWAFVAWSGASSTVAGRPCSTWACYAAPRLRPRAGRGHDLLHRLHRGLPRLLGLPARAARPLGAARGPARHAVRGGLGGLGPVAGRLVSVIGRRITLIAISVMMVGLVGLVVVAPDGRGLIWPYVVPALLVAGLGGGAVVSPNFTLTLERVPPRMGGAAGGALQTGQRIGSALGAALLMTAYRLALGQGMAAQNALRVALATALVLLSIALVLAVRDFRRRV
ncbi:MAG: MFS transporter [Nocardioides sp.]